MPNGESSVAIKKARYFRLSGTSMAAAVTSGVVALMIEANKATFDVPLTPNTVKAILDTRRCRFTLPIH